MFYLLKNQQVHTRHLSFFHRQDFWYNHFHQRIQFVHRNNNLRYFTGQLFTMNMKGRSSFQDTQEKCCSIEMVEEPEEKFRFRYKSEMQVNKCCRRRRRRTKWSNDDLGNPRVHTWENLFKEEQDFPNGRGKRVNAMVELEDDAIFKSPGDSVRRHLQRFSSV